MSERMKKIVVGVPEPMRISFLKLLRADGRKAQEIIRGWIAEFVKHGASTVHPR